jgi:hypothetical protein
MANRIRFLSLTLAGFGRYDRPTRFNLDGRSCSFTSPNELGKSTFQAGLLATLFGPPAIKAKVAAFQSRYRSWNGPIAFSGELEFTVNDEPWRIHHDFDAVEVKVWRLPKDSSPELRYQAKLKTARIATEPDPYARMLEDWLGMTDRSFYEAMFTISQETTLSTSWQIDPRIASLVYGPSVERLNNNLQLLFDRFREITRNTREFQISVGSQGERNGRSDGRLDQVIARIAELEASLQAAHQRSQFLVQQRTQLAELESQCDQLRQQLTETSRSLASWQAWIEMESRLQPAVDSYERLRQLNERCQQVTRPLAELRGRLADELAIFDRTPDDLTERLEYYPLLGQAVEEAKQRHTEATNCAEQLQAELGRLQDTLDGEFQHHRGRPELADQVEELRLVREEIVCVKNRLHELTESTNVNADDRMVLLNQLDALSGWRALATDAESRIAEVRIRVEQFCRDDADYRDTENEVQVEQQWLAEQSDRINQQETALQALKQTRDRERSVIAGDEQTIRAQVESVRGRKVQLETTRRDLERRYSDFSGAPANLPELWDRLHEQEAQQAEARGRVHAARDSLQEIDRRIYWRRGLTAFGCGVAGLCVLSDHGWFGWCAAAVSGALCASLRWIYRTDATETAGTKRKGQQAEAEQIRLARGREELVAQTGDRFVVPAEREAEWRRLWPNYRRERERLEAEILALPSDQQLSEMAAAASDKENRLARYDAETAELLAESEQALNRARAELERRQLELDRLRDRLAEHHDRYFGSDQEWRTQTLLSLGEWWQRLLQVATADRPSIASIAELTDWCGTQDEQSWSRFAASCAEVRRLQQLLAPDPEVAAATEAAIAEATELLRSLEEQEFRLVDSIVPFTAETDVAWLRERWQACQSVEARIADVQHELEALPNPDRLATEVVAAEAQHAEAAAALAPFLDRFNQDPSRISAAIAERIELLGQVRELERQAIELLTESGFTSLEELAHEAGKAEGLVGTIRAESQELLAGTNELWAAVDAPPELATQRAGELEGRRSEQQASLDACERERAELVAMIRQLEADPANDPGSFQTELELLRAERVELEKQRDQIAAEFQEANRLMQELQRVERTALEGRITAFFADFSRTIGRRVELDDELRIAIRNEDGTRYLPEQLSHGARDQLYLAVYLATTAGFDLPFILDDPFVNCDAERLAAIRACWDRLIPDHQLILLSHDPLLAGWAPTLEMRDAA